MKKLTTLLILYFQFLIPSARDCFSQSGWYPLSSSTSLFLYSMSFVNSNTGFIGGAYVGLGGSGGSVKTTDGGLSWAETYIDMQVFSIFFIDASIGFSVGSRFVYPPPPPTTYARIYKTFDGGLSWNLMYQSTNIYLTSVYFVNSNTGFAGGYSGSGSFIMKSTNSGASWSSQLLSNSGQIRSVYFPSASTGYAVGSYVFKTTDTGTNWSMQSSGGGYSTYFLDVNTGYCAGSGGAIIITTNGGGNWLNQTSTTTFDLYSIFFVNYNTGYCVGANGKILKTSNGGTNWLSQPSGTNNYLSSVFFTDSVTGYAAGAQGIILKTTTGGIVPVSPITNETPVNFALYQNYPNPFNPSTKIEFRILKSGFAALKVFDILGREAATLVYEQLKPGTYEVDWNASNYPSGVYYYKLTAGDYIETKKMILIR